MNTTLDVDPDVELLGTQERKQKIRYAKINIAEFLEGVKDLKIEEIGFYTLILFRMYDNMGALPDDDRRGAADMRCDIRVYRRIKALLIAKGKLKVANGKLLNYRVAREIMDMKAEFRRRSEAATEREGKRKGLGLAEQSAEPSALTNAELSRTSGQKLNKINGRPTTIVPQPCENSAGIQNPLKEVVVKGESENPTKAATSNAVAVKKFGDYTRAELDHIESRLLSACNGSLASNSAGLASLGTPILWMQGGADLEQDIVPALSAMSHRKKGGKISSWDYFSKGVADARDKRLAGADSTSALFRQDDFAARRKAEEIRKMMAIVGNGPQITGFRDD